MLTDRDIDAIAVGVVELLRGDEREFPRRGLVEVDDVCRWLRVEREWVYEHKWELGAVRIGDGERGPLRFDAAMVLAYVESHRLKRAAEREPRRRAGRPRKRRGAEFDLLQIPEG